VKATPKPIRLAILAALTIAAAGLIASTGARAADLEPGNVYVMTNQASNSIAIFTRAADGTLTAAGEVLTGGAGDPLPQGLDPAFDPLASQGALTLSPDKQFLLAVNAGSHEISVLRIDGDTLTLVNKVSSGGIRPISVTVRGKLVYVLNEGDPNVTGFKLDAGGTLTPLDGSTRALPGGLAADPAQVGWNFDADILLVTEKATSTIDSFSRQEGGLVSDAVAMPSNGLTPFGFAFDKKGNVVVTEAAGGASGLSSVSSYSLNRSGSPSSVSPSVPNFQTASCWVVITKNKRHAFVSNTGSGTISSYRVGDGGELTLVNQTAASTGIGRAPTDMTFGNGSRYLYVLDGQLQVIHGFKVEADRSLTPIGDTPGVPLGSQGIAAR
jgi:6-phosphogluconolactonase (cycloisomerase 2 family)